MTGRFHSANKKTVFFTILFFLGLCAGCSNDEKTGVSSSGISPYVMGLSAAYGGSALPADGSSQATILVEVWDSAGKYVDGVTVTLSASRGTLATTAATTGTTSGTSASSITLTTSKGTASAYFTAGKTAGAAYINATAENARATVKIVLATF